MVSHKRCFSELFSASYQCQVCEALSKTFSANPTVRRKESSPKPLNFKLGLKTMILRGTNVFRELSSSCGNLEIIIVDLFVPA